MNINDRKLIMTVLDYTLKYIPMPYQVADLLDGWFAHHESKMTKQEWHSYFTIL